jgi:HSP20 family molecular chaperone IbpA
MIYLNSHFDKFFDGFFAQPTYSNMVVKNSDKEPYEVNYTKDGAYLFFDVPGFNKSNLKVEMEGGVLYIEGKRTYKLNGEDTEKVISQKFRIGQEYNPDNIEATIEDGILTVFVSNYKKTEKKKRISLL